MCTLYFHIISDYLTESEGERDVCVSCCCIKVENFLNVCVLLILIIATYYYPYYNNTTKYVVFSRQRRGEREREY